ncbi:hypothetical protein [Flavobacterium luteolum]|uniref:hypothetical protein n=1 Tax=Flavobacterium luteolum TaxID=3003259 RepID=UPI00248E5477|nr:hypothetical protein [Flavobacterium luteolum]
MKNLFFASLTILFCSCSTDDFNISDANASHNDVILSLSEKQTNFHLESTDDATRKIMVGNRILIASNQIAQQILPIIVEGKRRAVTEKIAFQSLSNDTISMETSAVAALFAIIEESILNLALQADVKNYIINLSALQGEEYAIVDDYIMQYELSVRNDEIVNSLQKSTILAISSISEAVLFSEKKRKDRDWETSTASKHSK